MQQIFLFFLAFFDYKCAQIGIVSIVAISDFVKIIQNRLFLNRFFIDFFQKRGYTDTCYPAAVQKDKPNPSLWKVSA